MSEQNSSIEINGAILTEEGLRQLKSLQQNELGLSLKEHLQKTIGYLISLRHMLSSEKQMSELLDLLEGLNDLQEVITDISYTPNPIKTT